MYRGSYVSLAGSVKTSSQPSADLAAIRHPDVLVLGIHRSGTSFVSGVLHNHFNICMGHNFIRVPESDKNRKGSYECAEMFIASIRLCGRYGGAIRPKDPEMSAEIWLRTFGAVHSKCIGLCGVKCPHLAWANSRDILKICPKLIIVLHRIHGSIDAFWDEVYAIGQGNLDRIQDTLGRRVNFANIVIPRRGEGRLSEEELITKLDPYIKELRSNV